MKRIIYIVLSCGLLLVLLDFFPTEWLSPTPSAEGLLTGDSHFNNPHTALYVEGLLGYPKEFRARRMGISGLKITDYVKAYEERREEKLSQKIQLSKAQKIYIVIGCFTNDLLAGVPNEKIITSLKKTIEFYNQFSTPKKSLYFMCVTPPPLQSTSRHFNQGIDFNKKIIKTGHQMGCDVLIDSHRILTPPPSNDFISDNIHLSYNRGRMKMALAIASQLEKNGVGKLQKFKPKNLHTAIMLNTHINNLYLRLFKKAS